MHTSPINICEGALGMPDLGDRDGAKVCHQSPSGPVNLKGDRACSKLPIRPEMASVTSGGLKKPKDSEMKFFRVAMPFVPFVASLLLVAMPGAPSSVLAPSSKARSP